VGQQEVEARSVNVRTRDNEVQGTILISDLLAKFKKATDEFQ
jgi:threonyl-tRNA synthetase